MTKKSTAKAKARIQAIREQIAAVELVAQGTLSKRTKVCGRPNCRCASDPAARHGPYYEWTRSENGRYTHSVVSVQQAKQLRRAISNMRKLRALLKRWCNESKRALEM